MATFTYDTAGHPDDGGPQRHYVYDDSRPRPANPAGCRTNMTYDTGPAEPADRPLVVTVQLPAPPGEQAG